jgi:hypothetical protein
MDMETFTEQNCAEHESFVGESEGEQKYEEK